MMNGRKQAMEQDSRKVVEYKKGIEIEDEKIAIDGGEANSKKQSEDGFLDCQPKGNLDNEERQKIINSVKLTKALVLLGYSCWSQLEPGELLLNNIIYFTYYNVIVITLLNIYHDIDLL